MEQLKHECGVAMIRLLKPLEYYEQKYGTWKYGLNKLYLMMEKEHNRGQEGAGIASVKLDTEPGHEYMFRERAEGKDAIDKIFATDVNKFRGELYMGHLRYSTTGKSGMSYVHPFLRRNNWKAKNLCLCGNFNMTNIDEIFQKLTRQGQCPRIYSDSYIMLEHMGHRLDREVERNFIAAQAMELKDTDITRYIEDHVKMSNVLKTAMSDFDGGYVVCGMTGSGEMFSMRDPWGIRPAFYYINDEVVVLASERPVLQTCFDLECDDIKELEPGTALLVKRNGQCAIERILEQKGDSKCSFERIYFSRGNDRDIYKERKQLGEQLTQPVLNAISYDTEHTVFSFIPNTAEVAYYGMLHGFEDRLNAEKTRAIIQLSKQGILTEEAITAILSSHVRSEKVAIKDIKLRTFITEHNARNDMAAHVYDVTYGTIEDGVDNLVVIDDSIVRGTTLKNSIVKILSRLRPKKLVIVSSSPQVRYPDFYGIDMANLQEFIAFKAAVALLAERGMLDVMEKVYQECKASMDLPKEECHENYVKQIYAPFTDEEISKMIGRLVTDEGSDVPVECIYQTIDGLHEACPGHTGDWYFSGNYPTPGGLKLLYRAYVQYYESISKE